MLVTGAITFPHAASRSSTRRREIDSAVRASGHVTTSIAYPTRAIDAGYVRAAYQASGPQALKRLPPSEGRERSGPPRGGETSTGGAPALRDRGDEAPPLPRDLSDRMAEPAASRVRMADPARRRLRWMCPRDDRDAGFHNGRGPPVHRPAEPSEAEHRGRPRCPRPPRRARATEEDVPRAPGPREASIPHGPGAGGERVPTRPLGSGPRPRGGAHSRVLARPDLVLRPGPRGHERDVLRCPEGRPFPGDEPRR